MTIPVMWPKGSSVTPGDISALIKLCQRWGARIGEGFHPATVEENMINLADFNTAPRVKLRELAEVEKIMSL